MASKMLHGLENVQRQLGYISSSMNALSEALNNVSGGEGFIGAAELMAEVANNTKDEVGQLIDLWLSV